MGIRIPSASLNLAALLAWLLATATAGAQTTAVLRGVVLDEDGGVLPGAALELRRPATGFAVRTVTGVEGRFELPNVPFGPYLLRVSLDAFRELERPVALTSIVPADLTLTLALDALTTAITVQPAAPLVDAVSGGTRHQLGEAWIAALPAALGSRGLESVLATLPGFAPNANGAIHPRGAHNQMTYLIDGLPVSDQLTGAFANALDTAIVHNVELMTGNIPAEFGGKVSGVAVVTTRSGMGTGRGVTGDVTVAGGGFGTAQVAAQAGGERGRAGYFVSATGMRTDRFLDQISRDNLHNAGGFGRAFARVDAAPGPSTRVRLNAMGGRSAFEVANLRSQQQHGQDQRQALADLAVWGSVVHAPDARSSWESTLGVRHATAALDGSAGDTPVTATQQRALRTWTASVRYVRQLGAQELLGGLDAQRVPVREAFTMAITDAGFNDPASPRYNHGLAPHDLTRGGAPFTFGDARAGHSAGGYVQARLRTGRATSTLGVRTDAYAFLVRAVGVQPRLGTAVALPARLGVVRASFNRNLQTPPNENLLLSNSAAAARLAPESVRRAFGTRVEPIRPERQDVVEAGWQTAVGAAGTLDVSIYRKHSTQQQDNNNFFDTGIIFPVTLAAIRSSGLEGRLALRSRRNVSGTASVTLSHATSTPPFTGGLFLGQDAVDLLSAGPFAIDHDQRLSAHGAVHVDPPGPFWAAASVRYDSGLVANPSDPAAVAADPDFADLLPWVNLTARIPRVRPRTLADVSAGWDLRRASGRAAWRVDVQVTNLTNRTALYNFQSVFVGTRMVQPRTVALRARRSF